MIQRNGVIICANIIRFLSGVTGSVIPTTAQGNVIDVIVKDNVFFNDFVGSGRTNNNDTSVPFLSDMIKLMPRSVDISTIDTEVKET